MSKIVIDRSSILLGSGDVYVVDSTTTNFASMVATTNKANLLCKMDKVRIYVKKTDTITKKLVDGIVMDDEIYTNKMEFFFEFVAYEHTTKTQAVMFGGGVTDLSTALGCLMLRPKNLRFEIKFKFPLASKYMWYILPKCRAVSEFDFSPENDQGFTMKGTFRALPAINDNAIWYTATTPCFHNYIV